MATQRGISSFEKKKEIIKLFQVSKWGQHFIPFLEIYLGLIR